MKNKMSIWAIIILVATIVLLGLLIVSVVTTAIGIPVVVDQARQAAQEQGISGAEVEVAIGIAVGTAIFMLVLLSLFDILKIIGGFKFSLQGRWGLFCIVVSIISAVADVISVINSITQKSAVSSIVIACINLAISLLLVVACLKHRAELQK